jgi:hypothetical protein
MIGLIAFVVLCSFYLVRCLLSPLNAIPGPALAKYTSLVLKWHEFNANRTRYVHGLHLKYGPAVRLAPYEVAFASQAAVKEIYCSGGSGYDKTEFYDLFKVYGRRYVPLQQGRLLLFLTLWQNHVYHSEQGRCKSCDTL